MDTPGTQIVADSLKRGIVSDWITTCIVWRCFDSLASGGVIMALNDKLFFPKDIVCPVCEKSFTRYALRKSQYSINKRDVDYRPIYLGQINPRFFAIAVCPHCFYAAEDRYFCPRMTEDDMRRKAYFDSHKARWEARSRVQAASSGQQIWKDAASDKLKEITPSQLAILKRISPLLKKSAADIIAKGKPVNELQKEVDLDVALRAYELAAICLKARQANHRIMGYIYLHGAWTSRDAYETSNDEQKKNDYKEFEMAYLREAISFLTITNKATSLEDQFLPDGSRIPKENIPQSRIFEVMYILAGIHRLVGNIAESDKFLEQIIYGSSSAQGVILWFVKQAREMRQDALAEQKAADRMTEADDQDYEDDESDPEDYESD